MTFPHYLAQAPEQEFWVWCIGAATLSLIAWIASFVFLRRSRLIEDTPTSRIRSAAQGYAELEGRARLMEGPLIICPLSAARCVWWHYTVEEKVTESSGGRSQTRWRTVDNYTSDDLFLMDDGTGTCVVDPVGAKVIPSLKRRWYGYSRRPDIGPEAGKGLLRALFCKYRYTEELLNINDRVYGLGLFRTQSDAGDAFDESTDLRELLNKWKHDKQMMALLDVNKDGHVDTREWEAARRMALQQLRRQQLERAVNPDINVLCKPRDRRPFILSGVPQDRLARRYHRYTALCLALAFIAGGFATWTLTLRGLL